MIQSEILEINIGNEISNILFIRQTAIDLFEKIKTLPEQEIIINFQNVNFSNRSFAHEYFTQKRKCSKTVSEICLSDDVEKMFDFVKKKDFSDCKNWDC
jgi:hypothetical protein